MKSTYTPYAFFILLAIGLLLTLLCGGLLDAQVASFQAILTQTATALWR